jgi:hypothetical protein
VSRVYDDGLAGRIESDGSYKVTALPVAPGTPRSMWVVRCEDTSEEAWQVQHRPGFARANMYGPHPRRFKSYDAAVGHAIRQCKAYNRSWRRTVRARRAAGRMVTA